MDTDIQKAYQFIKEVGIFYIATSKEDQPKVRPFGAILLADNCLYISTAKGKDVYLQLMLNPAFEIVALKQESRAWIRIRGLAYEETNVTIKELMIKDNPLLLNHFDSASCPNFKIFKLTNLVISYY